MTPAQHEAWEQILSVAKGADLDATVGAILAAQYVGDGGYRHVVARIEAESAEQKRGTKHLAALQAERTRPIYMVDPHADIPMSRRMPVEQLTAFLGPRCEKLERTPYYTSTFAFMIASAVMGIVQR